MQADVAIIGGGPAGCAAALALISRGISVVVVSQQTQKAKPTETSVPELARFLRSLGAATALSACEPCQGIVSAWGTPKLAFRSAITNPYGHPWFIHRLRFDALFQQAARERGAEWIVEEAQSITTNQDGISIFTNSNLVRARWAVIATGSPKSAGRLTGQNAMQFDSMIAFWTCLPTKHDERLLRLEAVSTGWWYLCPADGPGAIACFVTDPTTARNLRPDEPQTWNKLFRETHLHRQVADEPSSPAVHVALTGLAALPQTHGSHWVAIGDAAAKLDPLGSSGTVTAVDSGQRAAIAIATSMQGSTSMLEKYSRWNAGLLAEFTRQRRHRYQFVARSQATEFWSRRTLAGGCSATN